MKLLIAEDDPFFRRILEQLLGSEFEISTAADGRTSQDPEAVCADGGVDSAAP